MDRDNEQRINLSKDEIKEMIKDLEPGTMLVIDVPDSVKSTGYASIRQNDEDR